MSTNEALEELREIADQLDLADDDAAKSNDELRTLSDRIRDAVESI